MTTMSHHVVGLDVEDMTPKQLRMALRHAATMSSMKHRRKKEDKDDGDDDDADEENDELVDLHEEKRGDSKPPKVTEDDLPTVVSSKLKKKSGKGDA
jgi:hypothetical protein